MFILCFRLKLLEAKLPESKSCDDGWESVMMYRNVLRSKKSLSQNNHQSSSQIGNLLLMIFWFNGNLINFLFLIILEKQLQCEPE